MTQICSNNYIRMLPSYPPAQGWEGAWDESEIRERDDFLGENERDGVNGNWKRKDGDAILPLQKPTCWSAQDFDDQHGPFPRGG
jgi:hypothetical protein